MPFISYVGRNSQQSALVVNYGFTCDAQGVAAVFLPQAVLSVHMVKIHETADISDRAHIGDGTQIWHHAQVREDARVGRNCILGKGVYVDFGVVIGDNCKLQNGAYIYHGATLEAGVFVGPGAILTNDRLPRAINPDGTLKTDQDWEVGPVRVQRGASLGAGCVVLPQVTIGEFAVVGAGAVVTRDVPAHGLVVGNPARLVGYACRCGRRLVLDHPGERLASYRCANCDIAYQLPQAEESAGKGEWG